MRGLLIDDVRSLEQARAIANERYRPDAQRAMIDIEEWDIARSLPEAKRMMEAKEYEVVLVDHDLGSPDTDGSHALAWLAQRWVDQLGRDTDAWLPEHVFAVSANPVGVQRIMGWAETIANLRADHEEASKETS